MNNSSVCIKKLSVSDYSLLEQFMFESLTFSKQPNTNEVKENWKS